MSEPMRKNYGFKLSSERIDALRLAVIGKYFGPKRFELMEMLLRLQYLTRDCKLYHDVKDHPMYAKTRNELNRVTEEFIEFTKEHSDDFMQAVVSSEILFEETARKFMYNQ